MSRRQYVVVRRDEINAVISEFLAMRLAPIELDTQHLKVTILTWVQ